MDTNSNLSLTAAATEVGPIAERAIENLRNLQNLNPEEFRDTIEDVLKGIIIVEVPLADGFQWTTDLIQLLQIQPVIQEIFNDAGTFYGELVNIIAKDPSKAVTAIKAAYNNVKLGFKFGKVSTAFANVLFVLANNADAAYKTYDLGLLQKTLWEQLLKGANLLEEGNAGTLGLV